MCREDLAHGLGFPEPAGSSPFADRLEAEARALPRKDPRTAETWYELADRQYEAELALAQQLRALPGCELTMCSSRVQVRLELLGVTINTAEGLAAACQLWATTVRERLGTSEGPAL